MASPSAAPSVSDGVVAAVTDGEGRRWTYTYGAFDVLQAIEDPKGGRLSVAYDGTEYFNGRASGPEVEKGAGPARIPSLLLTYDAGR